MKTAFTPGPWKAGKRVGNVIKIDHSHGNVNGAITLSLCHVQARQSWVEEAEANAALIAAAPELFAALVAIAEFIPTTSASDGGAAKYSQNVRAADMVRAAIKKATGQS